MSPVLWIALLLVPVALLTGWLWRRESRRLGTEPRGWFWPAATGLVLLGGVLYVAIGYDAKTGQWIAERDKVATVARELREGQAPSNIDEDTNVRALAMTLQQQLAREPSASGWYALALIFNEAGQGQSAVEAAQRALALSPEQRKPEVRLLLARSMINRAGGRLTEAAEAQIRQVLEQYPEHDGAWTLLAMSASRSGRHELAVEAFESLLARHGDSEIAGMLEQGLAKARSQARQAKAFNDIRITVEAPETVEPGGTLFLFLRREGGSGQPLAARRYLVDRFPVTLSVRAQDWLQAYPDPAASLVAGARYSSAPGGRVDKAGLTAPAAPLGGEAGAYHARLRLKP